MSYLTWFVYWSGCCRYPTPIYELLLTHDDNTTSLRKYFPGNGEPSTVATNSSSDGLLSRSENRSFWLTLVDGDVQFGRGMQPGTDTILRWIDDAYTSELFVKVGIPSRNGVFVGVMTAGDYGEQAGGSAEWEICHPFWCTGCPAGSFSGTRGSWSCQACPKGRAAGLSGTVECELCGPG